MNMNSGSARLVLLSPGWKRWGTASTVKPGTVILHSRADDVVPFAASEELVRNSGLPASALIEVGNDHPLFGPEPLKRMLEACEGSCLSCVPIWDTLFLERDEMATLATAVVLLEGDEGRENS